MDQLITDEKNNYTNVQIKNDNKKYLDKSIASISNNTKVVSTLIMMKILILLQQIYTVLFVILRVVIIIDENIKK